MDKSYLKNVPIKSNGFALLEIMIALSISLLLIGTLLLVFLQTKMSYQGVMALSNIQDNGRFAYVFLTNAIRQAKNISVYSDNHLPASFQKRLILGTDVLVVQNKESKEAYFVADTHRLNQRGQSIYALYEKKWLPGVETMRRELVPGVDSMHIRLNSDTQSLVVNLYLNSIDPLPTGLLPFIYTDNANSYFGEDLRLHRKWPVPIALKSSTRNS